MSKSRKKGVCTYCGARGMITRDHVPPKSLFAAPRPALITVPACLDCHGPTNKDDEYFRSVLSLRDTANTPDAEAAREGFLRSLQRVDQAGLKRAFLSGVRQVRVRTPAGIHLGTRGVYDVELERLDRVISRTIRGLYFHHHKVRLPPDAKVTSWAEDGLHDLDWSGKAALQKFLVPLGQAAEHIVGNAETFRYRFVLAADAKYASAWLLTVYNSTNFIGLTIPAELVAGEQPQGSNS